jgi:hypothetical protein
MTDTALVQQQEDYGNNLFGGESRRTRNNGAVYNTALIQQ